MATGSDTRHGSEVTIRTMVTESSGHAWIIVSTAAFINVPPPEKKKIDKIAA